MPILTRSLADYLSEVKRANRAVFLEMASALSFLVGFALAVVALWPLVVYFWASVMPEDNDHSLTELVLPQFDQLASGKIVIVITVLIILIPATLLMSAGVVIRHFWEKK
jgi:hypothetical protein